MDSTDGGISIRPLEPREWQAFRDFRLAALRAMPGVFSSAYEGELARAEDWWRDTLGGPGRRVFGLFDGDRLIGITAVFTSRDDPSGSTALLAMSFILPDYRGRGLSDLFYRARLAWVRERPQFKRILVSHRASNEASRRANQRHGFILVGRAPRTWPDGSTEDELSYELAVP